MPDNIEGEWKPELYISYPAAKKKELPKGRTTLNWRDGYVSLPGEETETLSGKLPPDRTLKSLLIFTEARLDVELLGEGTAYRFSAFPNEFPVRHVEFSFAAINTYRITTAYFIASTNPQGPSHVPATFYEGKPFTKNDVVATAGSPVVLDVRGFLNRNAHVGTIENKSNTETLYVYLSDDTETYTDMIPVEASQGFNLEKEDVAKIKIDASANNTPYFVVAH